MSQRSSIIAAYDNLLGKTYYGHYFGVMDMRTISSTTLDPDVWSDVVLSAVSSSGYLLEELNF